MTQSPSSRPAKHIPTKPTKRRVRKHPPSRAPMPTAPGDRSALPPANVSWFRLSSIRWIWNSFQQTIFYGFVSALLYALALCLFLAWAWIADIEFSASISQTQLEEDVLTLPGVVCTFVFVLAVLHTPWRMYRASDLVRQMTSRGFALAPGVSDVRPLRRWPDLFLIGMRVLGVGFVVVLVMTVVMVAFEDWLASHPSVALFAAYAAGPIIYLMSTALIAIVVSESLSKMSLVPVPFHEDHCNGFAPIGEFAMWNVITAWFVFATIPHLLVFSTTSDVAIEVPRETVWILYGGTMLWIMLADLAMSMWEAHVVMERHRSDTLEATTRDISTLLAASDRGSRVPNIEVVRLLALETKYQIVRREFRVWPFGFLRFAGVASLGAVAGPVIGALAGPVIERWFL
jgi:hypothetical protein